MTTLFAIGAVIAAVVAVLALIAFLISVTLGASVAAELFGVEL